MKSDLENTKTDGLEQEVSDTGLQGLLQRIASASIYDPGETDLDDEQPVTVRGFTLGDVRLARRLVR